jgi:ppGpp synthetase/RelA/SpoT-type nucleotidyltranferase
MNAFSKTQIDRLGDRLKGGTHTESALRLLDDYRRSFGEAYEAVVGTIRQCGESPTGRPAKSTFSIVEKLRRESMRLSQMQDIAGCRVVVGDIVEQKQFVASLRTVFHGASVIDRRDKPSYGYRAVHIITEISGKPVEIQVRTALQHLWAELSEKSSDVLDPAIKYGGGPDWWRSFLKQRSESVASYEEFEKRYSQAVATHEVCEKTIVELPEHHVSDHDVQEMRGNLEHSTRMMEELTRMMKELRAEMVRILTEAIAWLDKAKGRKQ